MQILITMPVTEKEIAKFHAAAPEAEFKSQKRFAGLLCTRCPYTQYD